MAATSVTVSSTYELGNGDPASGTVVFRPTRSFQNENTIVAAPIVARLNAGGTLSVQLFANTDDATVPADTGYYVREELYGHHGGINAYDSLNKPIVREYSIQVPHDAGATAALADLVTTAVSASPDVIAAGTRVRVDGEFVPELDIDSGAIQVGDLDGVNQEDAAVGGYLTATQVTDPGTDDAVVTEWSVVNPPPQLPVPNNWTGRYIHPVSPASASTSATMTNGTLRLCPWFVPTQITIDRIGAECTVVGDAGSKIRIGIYSDNGHAFPGALLLDAGQVAGDSATVQDITVSQVLPAGLYWVGGVIQAVTTTQPTIRITNTTYIPVPIVGSNTTPTAGTTATGYAQTSVTGALPANFTTSITTTGSAPRLHVRIA